MLNEKKAITVRFIILLLVSLISFTIIVAWFRTFPYREIINKETCHQSVMLRSMQGIGEITKRKIPLRCKTEHIIISESDEEQIKKKIANAMYDCWWMLGEGKLNFFPSKLTRENYCIICSTIEFKSRARDKKIDIYTYLKERTIPSKDESFLEYLSNGNSEIVGEAELLDTNKEYAIVFSFFKGEFLTNILMSSGTAIIGAKAGAIIGTIVPGPGTVVGTGIGFIVGGVLGNLIQSSWKKFVSSREKDYFASLHLVEYDPQEIRDIGCTDLKSIP